MVAQQTKARPTPDAARGLATPPARPTLVQGPVPHPGPRAARRSRASRWRSPMTAVLAGTFLVSLLCCYVYAYACVAAAGFEQSSLLHALHQARREEEALHAEVSRLALRATVERRAQSMGMVPAVPQATEVLRAEAGRETEGLLRVGERAR